MKTLAYIVIALFTTTLTAQSNDTITLNVTIDNVVNDKGQVHIAVYDENTFMKSDPIKSIALNIKDGKVMGTFKGMKAGEYGIIVFHDMNENGRMDFQPNGMPTEDYGTSNNVLSYGPPSWKDSKFTATEDMTVNVRL